MNKAFATLEELKASRLKKPEKPDDPLDEIWCARKNPAPPTHPSPNSILHHSIARKEYAAACKELKIKGPAKNICLKECSRVGCDRGPKSCTENHTLQMVDPAAIKECPHALLVMSVFGGFKGTPVTYSPDQITTTVQTLFNKLQKNKELT